VSITNLGLPGHRDMSGDFVFSVVAKDAPPRDLRIRLQLLSVECTFIQLYEARRSIPVCSQTSWSGVYSTGERLPVPTIIGAFSLAGGSIVAGWDADSEVAIGNGPAAVQSPEMSGDAVRDVRGSRECPCCPEHGEAIRGFVATVARLLIWAPQSVSAMHRLDDPGIQCWRRSRKAFHFRDQMRKLSVERSLPCHTHEETHRSRTILRECDRAESQRPFIASRECAHIMEDPVVLE
jgi:hypothetical protein